jgi:uncharacterized protein (DUF2235 family)
LGRNIIICADGTGNTFDKGVSNVTRMIKLLALDNHGMQIVVYDQGIGTNANRIGAVEHYRKLIPDKNSLVMLPGPQQWPFILMGWAARVAGLLVGYGLKANVKEMYQHLSQLYEDPADKIYLFGFSRGAFAVRALAGLVYRCGLPFKGVKNFNACFDQAWELYYPQLEDENKIAEFRHECRTQRCAINFLGLWDTVKSYGGLIPVILPHLRHNPIVSIVRHALALNERRSWFNATTWGRLDSDRTGAELRIKCDPGYQLQDIEEVWFRGCHSDIGGGDAEAITGMIALRWILGEAAAVGLRLNENGKSVLASGR